MIQHKPKLWHSFAFERKPSNSLNQTEKTKRRPTNFLTKINHEAHLKQNPQQPIKNKIKAKR